MRDGLVRSTRPPSLGHHRQTMAPSLTIGIDARAAVEIPAGRGRVVRELLGALAARSDDHRYPLYCRRPIMGSELDERFRWRELAIADPAVDVVGCDVGQPSLRRVLVAEQLSRCLLLAGAFGDHHP
jgi:hypothetical protein